MFRLYEFTYLSRTSSSGCNSVLVQFEESTNRTCSTCGMALERTNKSPFITNADDTCVIGTDIVQNSGAWEGCVTERVIAGLSRHRLKGWDATPIHNNTIASSAASSSHPRLFILSTNHWGLLDASASGLGEYEQCPICGSIVSKSRVPDRLVIQPETFDMAVSDFFHFRPWGQAALYVTKRVVEVARIEKWKNAFFIPLGIPYTTSSRLNYAIDPLSKQWPPKENWD